LSLRIVAASIAGVEARHAAYINNLLGDVPFPSTVDNATAPSVIKNMISPFIVDCPYEITLPVPASVTCSKKIQPLFLITIASNVVSESMPTSKRTEKRATGLSETELARKYILLKA
jgi:hypothetical protein